MKTITTIIIACVLAGCALTPPPAAIEVSRVAQETGLQQLHEELLSLYAPIDQHFGDKLVIHSGLEPFSGDCDDYATAVMSRLQAAGIPVYTVVGRKKLALRETIRHMVACVSHNGLGLLCLDPNNRQISSLDLLKKQYSNLDIRKVEFAAIPSKLTRN